MLLTQKAYVEGAFDLGLYAARLFDDSHTAATEDERQQAQQLLDLLTPIVKSWPSEFCLKANELAIQILGGHGYTRDYPVEQYYRDNRLNPIHEGTHGIQSLDLLGRKLAQHGGAGLKQLVRLIAGTCAQAHAYTRLDPLREPLEQLLSRLQHVTLGLLGELSTGQVNSALANSALYLKAFGHCVIGWRWLEQAIRAEQGLARGNPADTGFYRGKLQAARFSSPGKYRPAIMTSHCSRPATIPARACTRSGSEGEPPSPGGSRMFDFTAPLRQRFAGLNSGAEFSPCAMCRKPTSTCRCARTSPNHPA